MHLLTSSMLICRYCRLFVYWLLIVWFTDHSNYTKDTVLHKDKDDKVVVTINVDRSPSN